LKAVGKKAAAIVANDSVKTTGAAAAIKLTADRGRIAGDGEDLSFVTVEVVDVNGLTVPTATNSMSFTCTGPGTIVGVDNGDATNQLSMKASTCPAYNGKCLVIVQSNGTMGNAVLAASATGLSAGSATIACSLATTGIQMNRTPASESGFAGATQLAVHGSNAVTNIQYHLSFSGAIGLHIYDAKGILVKNIVSGYQQAGTHRAQWDGKNSSGEKTGAGIYYCTLTAHGCILTKTIARIGTY
jgi:hypothetical protein